MTNSSDLRQWVVNDTHNQSIKARDILVNRGTWLINKQLPLGLCIGSYSDPRGLGVSYERGTPVAVE